jgi:hypothetical protein
MAFGSSRCLHFRGEQDVWGRAKLDANLTGTHGQDIFPCVDRRAHRTTASYQ